MCCPAPPRRLARRGFDRLPCLVDLLGWDLIGKWARERFMGLALGTTFLGTRQKCLYETIQSYYF